MPRKPLIRSDLMPYHITSRSNNREWFSLPMEDVWKICNETLWMANEKYKVELISFVLMSNHYHMLVRTPDANLDLFMYEFNKRLAVRLKDRSHFTNHILGGRYKWCLIQSNHYLSNCYRYVYQNPLRARMTDRCENYKFSTLHSIVHGSRFSLPIFDQMGFKDPFMLNWLNEPVEEDELSALRKGLYRAELLELKLKNKRSLVAPYAVHKSSGTL